MQLGNSCAYSKGQLGSRAQFGREGLALKGVGVVSDKYTQNRAPGFPGEGMETDKDGTRSLRKACFS